MKYIPPRAGEPRSCCGARPTKWVYPRACGGTALHPHEHPTKTGLSPRVRGNRPDWTTSPLPVRSIPARAGEPSAELRVDKVNAVYPRACGGTRCNCVDAGGRVGLSPRVRGNRQFSGLAIGLIRSIPARAGEPGVGTGTPDTTKVYPRACGGTQRGTDTRRHYQGLSPRVRGNQW